MEDSFDVDGFGFRLRLRFYSSNAAVPRAEDARFELYK